MRLNLLGPPDLVEEESAVLPAGAKQLATLSYLALGHGGRPVRRDELLDLLWPRGPASRSRAALRQLLVTLRDRLGDDAFLGAGDETLGLDPSRLHCDVWSFRERLDRGDAAGALELYRGELLEGFHLNGNTGWTRWLEGTRDALRKEACEAAWARARELAASGRTRSAIESARFAVRRRPLDEPGVRQLLHMLAGAGDLAGVLLEYRRFADRMEEEYAARPHPDTCALVRSIQEGAYRANGRPAFRDRAGQTAEPL